MALTSPVLGYVEDVRNAREELLSRLLNQAQVQSEALGVHLGLLEAELARVAGHPALSPEDGASPAELALLESAFYHSSLFSEGVALLTPGGERVWSDPPDMPLGRSPLTQRPWFRRMVEGRQPEIDLLEGEGGPSWSPSPCSRTAASRACCWESSAPARCPRGPPRRRHWC
ncbi:hypothetical protein QEG98_25840 [Myxococcus sp. MxC21-1]|uniref:hypothetical protein n=1 Tax=Myxococcus sp. MxC21-1 TaxID=3041439 RepID=UPI002930A984|nr:hypothetical protein [Myxococcus sp. MxC21-1]WNZ59472.1 hypothetical protein QEG98_25840 [Myxococcus sp. MxC21-1]